nr:8108_t:CDS:2 [Entrophospora candida]
MLEFGGSHLIKEIAKEIFPESFENNSDSFHWDDFPIEAQEIIRVFRLFTMLGKFNEIY